jgi:hypothetical protein
MGRGCRCAYGAREPLRQSAVLGIGFQFRGCHALEQFVQIDVFAAVDPLTLSIDLAVSLDGTDDSGSRNINFASFLDDLL